MECHVRVSLPLLSSTHGFLQRRDSTSTEEPLVSNVESPVMNGNSDYSPKIKKNDEDFHQKINLLSFE